MGVTYSVRSQKEVVRTSVQSVALRVKSYYYFSSDLLAMHLVQDLLNYTGEDVEEVFCLTFTIAETYFGEVVNKPLKPDGENIPVTLANKEEFVKLYVDYVLNKSCEASFDAFKKGFLRVVNNQVLQLFHAKVQILLGK